MTSIVVHFHAGRTPVDWIIQWRTNGNVTHASIEFSGLFIEALAMKGVVKHRNRRKDIIHSVRIECTEEEYMKMLDFAIKQVGKSYDWTAILGFRLKQNMIHDAEKYFCSELVFDILLEANKVPPTTKNIFPELLENTLGILYENRLGKA